MSSVSVILALVFILITLNGLLVLLQFSALVVRRHQLSEEIEAGSPLAQRLETFIASPQQLDRLVTVTQIGLAAGTLTLGVLVYQIASGPWLVWLPDFGVANAFLLTATGVIVLLSLVLLGQSIFGELLPKASALKRAETIAQWLILPMQFLVSLFGPIAWVFNATARLLLSVFGLNLQTEIQRSHSPSDIERLVSGSHESGLIDAKERQMLRNALRLRDLAARHVMVPRPRLVAAEISSNVEDLMGTLLEGGYSRLPLYDTSIDNIRGFVHIKDLFRLHLRQENDPSSIIREALFVPEGLPVTDVWEQLNRHRQYIAIVFDEHGGTAGLISLEDLIEEIFGELLDEFDQEDALMYDDQQGLTHLRADLLISDINEYFSLNLPDEDADTIGGLVFLTLGHIPQQHDEVRFGNIVIRVESVANMTITEVSLRLPPGVTADVDEWEVDSRD